MAEFKLSMLSQSPKTLFAKNRRMPKAKNTYKVTSIRQLWLILSPARKTQLLSVAALLVLIGLVEMASLGLFGALLQVMTVPDTQGSKLISKFTELLRIFGVPKESLVGVGTIQWLALGFGLAVSSAGFLRILATWVNCHLTASLGTDLATEVYERCLDEDYEEHIRHRAGELVSLVRDKSSEVVSVIFYFLTLLTSLIVGLLIVGGLTLLDPAFFAVTASMLGSFYAACGLFARRRMLQNSRRSAEGTTLITKAVQEGFGSFRDIILEGGQKVYANIFRRAQHQARHANAMILFLSMAPRYLNETAAMLFFVALLWWGVVHWGDFGATLPRLGVLVLGAQRLMPLVQQGYMSWAVLTGSSVATRMVLEVLSRNKIPRDAGLEALPFEKSLKFQDVSFRYAESKPWILRKLNFQLKKGGRIGLVGTTGSGKSTFADLLMGLLWPTQGKILVDGKPLRKKDLPRWRKNIAHVPQEIFLLDASFAENIALGCEAGAIDMIRVRESAQKAQIASFIESKPRGYFEEVGDRGRNLSGGQRQRIGIARALYKGAQLLVLDEATSALDEETERAVIKAINSLNSGLTIFVITHRGAALKKCDKIVSLKKT
jgi:ATP-binding cassette, subfamily B, bacterial PglK